MSLRLFPGLATRLAQPTPRALVRQFSAAVRPPTAPISMPSASLAPQTFFTSSTPKMQFLSGALSSSRLVAGRAAGPAWSPSSFTGSFFRRAFSTSRSHAARAQYYGRGGQGWQPPPPPPKMGYAERIRQRLNAIDPNRIVYMILGVNVAIFLVWQYAINNYKRFRDPSTYNWMYKNFINSMYNLREGRVWTLITSAFSHMDTAHVFMNCLGLYFVGPTVASVIGTAGFLGLYLGSGLISGITSLMAQANRPNNRAIGSDGASGAIYGTLSFFAGLFPTQKFLFFFVVPMPAWLLIGGIFTWDLYGTFVRRGSMTDSAGHVGGILSGLAAAMLVRRGIWRPRPW